MGSLYPDEIDRFIEWVSKVDDMVVADVLALFEAAVGVEAELGVEPSGLFGTIHGRLFAKGNISIRDGGWRMLELLQSVGRGDDYSADNGGLRVPFDGGKYKGRKTAWGDDTPAVFVSYRFPLVTGKGSGAFSNYLGAPWSPIVDQLSGELGQFFIGCRDAQHAFITLPGAVPAAYCNVMVWGLLS